VKSRYASYRAVLLALSILPGGAGWLARAESGALETARRLNEAFIEVADRVSPTVVVIEVAHRPGYTESESEDPFLEELPPEKRRSLEEHSKKKQPGQRPRHTGPVYDSRGSGVVIREDGWILTNEHVVRGAEMVRVRLKDGTRYSADTRWFTDVQSDIAVVKIPASGLTVAKLADSSKTRVGEFAIAIGAPFDLEYSVTFGHVSAKGRSHVIQSWMGSNLMASMDQDFIQTDASVNPGNSGGPLVNIDGEVMAVNTLVEGSNRGIGFAIPINLAKEVADRLIADGKFARAWLGIQIAPLSEDLAFRDWLEQGKEGVVVRKIIPNGPASRSGLSPADVITAVENVPVSTAQQLRNEIRLRKIGSPVHLDVLRPGRNGQHQPLQLTLKTEEWPEETRMAPRPMPTPELPPSTGLGLTVQTLTPALAEKYGVDRQHVGVVVTTVEPDSPAAQQRIRPGDVVTQLDRRPVTTAKEFQDALKRRTSRGLLLDLISDGAPEFRILKDSGD
jgi:serine protease Do